MTMAATCTIDASREGKNHGFLRIAESTNTSAWGYHDVPLTSLRRGDGPRVLVLAGNHGDEYEGQIAALTLTRRLRAPDVRGHLLIVPVLSLTASAAGTRLWPDGSNFNRVFPGQRQGTVAQRLACYLSEEVFPRTDCVIDMHSGGRGMSFIPSSTMVWVSDEALRKTMLGHLLAWRTGYHSIGGEQPGTDPHSLLPGDVVRQGKAVSTGEFGGAGLATAETVGQTLLGLVTILREIGVLVSTPLADEHLNERLDCYERSAAAQRRGQIIDMRASDVLVASPHDGLYENCVDLRDEVEQGQLVGRLHDLDSCEGGVHEVRAPRSGIVLLVRGFPPVRRGDVVCAIGTCYAGIDAFLTAAGEGR